MGRSRPQALRARLCNLARYRVIDTWRKTQSEHPADPGDPAALPERADHRHDEDSVIAATDYGSTLIAAWNGDSWS
jgi:hypothetical protein